MELAAAPEADEALAMRAAAGDSAALEALVVRYQERVFRLALRLTGDESDAADVLQETFLSVCRHLGDFRGAARFSTWLYQIAVNAARMHRRARARRPAESLERFLPSFDDAGRHVETPEALRTVCHIEEMLDRSCLAQRAREGIARLPEGYRSAFVLRDLEDVPTAEVGAILGLAPAAVRQRVHRARLLLRGYLSELQGVTP
jgi:RNA polymerase sigma-70 factor (ECF subfamily)